MRKPTDDNADESAKKQNGQVLIEALSKFLNQKLISEKRLNYPETQVISKENLSQIENLLSKPENNQFQISLSNLVFSANNPFQSNFSYVVDQAYKKQFMQKFESNYGKQTSIGYVTQQKHRAYHPQDEPKSQIANTYIDTSILLMQMEKKVKTIDLPLARKSEQRLHESNEYLQNSIEESAFWTIQEVFDEKQGQDSLNDISIIVDLISMDPLAIPKRPNLQGELHNVLQKLKERQHKQQKEMQAQSFESNHQLSAAKPDPDE